MAADIELSVTTMFRDAARHNVAFEMRTAADWDIYNGIRNQAKNAEEAEIRQFEQDRPNLIAAEAQKLIDEGGAPRLDHPSPSPTDRFNPTDIIEEAARRVDLAHQSRLLKIREDEANDLLAHRDSVQAREQVRGVSREAFDRATDRRDGTERRAPSRER